MHISTEDLLTVVIFLLLMIEWRLGRLDRRLKERFPTEAEQRREWERDKTS